MAALSVWMVSVVYRWALRYQYIRGCTYVHCASASTCKANESRLSSLSLSSCGRAVTGAAAYSIRTSMAGSWGPSPLSSTTYVCTGTQ